MLAVGQQHDSYAELPIGGFLGDWGARPFLLAMLLIVFGPLALSLFARWQ